MCSSDLPAQVGEVQVVALARPLQVDAVVAHGLTVQPLGDPGLRQRPDRPVLEDSRADARLDVLLRAVLDDDGVDAVLGEQMARVGEPPIQRGALADVGSEWTPCVSFELVCLTGEDKGVNVLYKTNSVGGRRAFADMMQLVAAAMDDTEGKCVPVVNLDCDSYPHKKYGKIYTPIFDIKKWVMPDAGELGGAPAKEPTATSVAAVQDKTEAAEEAPVRRRRR